MASVDEFLHEKRSNLVVYLRKEVPKEFEPYIKELEDTHITMLKAFIVERIQPHYPKHLKEYVEIQLDQHHIPKEAIKQEVFDKFMRYLECFCYVLSQ